MAGSAQIVSDRGPGVAYPTMQGSIVVVNGDGEDDRVAHADKAIESFTQATTRYLAAQLIAAPRFPERWLLPRLRAPVFANLGHQLLVDYEQLATVVWRVALDASAAVQRVRKLGLLVVIGLLAAALGLLLCKFGAPVLGGFELTSTCVALAVINNRQNRLAHEAVADVRADALNQLSRNDWTSPKPAVTIMAQVGNGALGLDQVPVLVMLNTKRPFPGFGQLRFEHRFTCRPKTDAPQAGVDELSPRVYARMSTAIREHSQEVFRAGEVVVVDGHTLSVNSPWLGADKAPRLWFPREALSEVHQLDPRAAARVFHASQILISCHATLTTFFVRVFPAGRSVTFHVAVATLGPPMTGIATIANRMVKHHVEVLRRSKPRTVETVPPAKTAAQLDEMAELSTIDLVNHTQLAFQAQLDLGEITKLDPIDEIGRAPGKYASARISSESAMWPGRITTQDALRETGSYDLTPSFFGKPEALSLIRAVYDQAIRAALETADDAGYDISDYRDRDGKFTIHADQIGQLVVSDQVTMTSGDRPHAEQSKSIRQAPAANGSMQ